MYAPPSIIVHQKGKFAFSFAFHVGVRVFRKLFLYFWQTTVLETVLFMWHLRYPLYSALFFSS